MIGLWTESTLVQTRRNDIVINLSYSNRLQGWGEVVFSIVIWEIVLHYNLLDNFNWLILLPNLSNYILAIDAKTDNIAHLRPTEQSTTFASGISALAVDGNPGNQCYFPRAYSTTNLIFFYLYFPQRHVRSLKGPQLIISVGGQLNSPELSTWETWPSP